MKCSSIKPKGFRPVQTWMSEALVTKPRLTQTSPTHPSNVWLKWVTQMRTAVLSLNLIRPTWVWHNCVWHRKEALSLPHRPTQMGGSTYRIHTAVFSKHLQRKLVSDKRHGCVRLSGVFSEVEIAAVREPCQSAVSRHTYIGFQWHRGHTHTASHSVIFHLAYSKLPGEIISLL